MEVDQHEQAMETDDLNSDSNAGVDEDGGATDSSQYLSPKEKRGKSKIDNVDKKDLCLIVGNGSRDSEDSYDSNKPEVNSDSVNVDGEREKNSGKGLRQQCVMNGNLSDHSSISSASEDEADDKKRDDKTENAAEKGSSSSHNGPFVEEKSVDNSEILLENHPEKLSIVENKDSENDSVSEDDFEEHKKDSECDGNETNKHVDNGRLCDDTDSKVNDEPEINIEEEGLRGNSENVDIGENEIDEKRSSKPESEKDGVEREVGKSNDEEKSEESDKNNEKSEKLKSDLLENDRTTAEVEGCVSKDDSEKVKKDGKPDGKDEPIEIDDDQDHGDSSSNIIQDKRRLGNVLANKKDKKFSSSSSLVGNPPFIDVTYSARGPVPTVTSIGGNNILNAAPSLRMVVPTANSGMSSSQSRPQYQNQFQFYLQGSSGNAANQYVSVLNTQAGNRAPNRPINSKPLEKIEPPKPPQSSLDMIELSRWEVKQGLHRRARNTKIRPESELSNLARFLRDFGQDLVKEAVYSDLVKIQQKRNSEGKLKTKEADDFKKLKSVHQELHEKVGPCKVQFNQKCSCGFRTESVNVMYSHKQRPHVDMYDMCCAYCSFNTRNPHAFKFHLEGEHNVQPIIEMKQPLWECNLCPYEHNIKNKLTQHKFKCTKNFKLHLNLHPAWMPGPEINFCLENIMYKQPIAKPPQPQLLNKQTIRAQSKVGPRLQAPRASDTIQQINAARAQAQAQQMMKFGGQRPGVAPNVNFFQGTPALQRTPLKNVSSSLTGNRSGGFLLNRMPSSNTMPTILMKSQVRNQTPKMSTVTPKSTTTNVTSKINNLITMNETMLDITSKGQANSGFEICEICGGYVKDRTALRIHFFYAHRIDMPYAVFDRIHPPLYCATCFSRFWTAQGLQKHLDVHKEDSSGGVAGKCVVCGHRVPNILMHMRIVHNKALNNFLKECKCIFCGTSFQNKTIVENHMAAIHGVVVKSGAPAESSSSSSNAPRQPSEKSGPASQKSGTALVKGSVCVLCNLNFGRNVDLTRHCMKVHHTCMKCGMVVADKLSLMKHTCLESATGLRNCELCGEKGFHPAYHVKHIRDKHLKRCAVKVKRLMMDKNGTVKVEPGSRSAGRSRSGKDDDVIDVDSQPSPFKKYKQCKESVRLYRESIKLALDNDSDSSTSKKRKLRNLENQSDDSSDKSIKKAKTCGNVGEEESEGNLDVGASDKAKSSEIDCSSNTGKTESDEKSKTENKTDTSEGNEMDASENADSSEKSSDKSEKVACDSKNSERNQDNVEESKTDDPKEAAADSPSSNLDRKPDAKDSEGEGSDDDGGAFCGFQSLTKPDKDENVEIDTGNSESDSE